MITHALRLLFAIVTLAACGEDAREGDTRADDASARSETETETGGTEVAPGELPPTVLSSPPPGYADPPWTESPPPSAGEVDAARDAIRGELSTRLDGSARATLDSAAAAHGSPAAAHSAALDRRWDAARWLLVATDAPTSNDLASLAALEILGGGAAGLGRAATLSRAALAMLGDVAADPITVKRTAASAWNNLGRARLGLGEAAGALHAYRQASALFPADPAYATGLAAALAAADLPLPAYQQARRARSLEQLADAALSGNRHTPARAWVTHLEGVLAEGIAPPPGAILVPRGGGAVRWPDVGSTLLGMEVVAALDDGIVVSAPAFEVHGDGHLSGPPGDCTIEENAVIDSRKAVFICPSVPGMMIHKPWMYVPERAVLHGPRLVEPGLTCDNALTRALAPEARNVVVRPFGLPNRAARHAAGLGLALQAELAATSATLGVPDEDIESIELCSDFSGGAGAWQAGKDILAARCDTCLCRDTNPDCEACWSTFADTCADLFRRASELAAREERRAFHDDIAHQANMARYFAMMPILTMMAQQMEACDGDCAESITEDYHWAWVEIIGGRYPGFLRSLREAPPIAFLECMGRVVDGCSEAVAGKPASSPDKVPCICLGAGPVSYCVQADGTVQITVDAGVSVGFQANIPEGASSIRVGVGAGVSASLGPATAGVSYMAWFDPTRGEFARHDFGVDVGLSLPGGGSVGSTFMCDAWRSDAPERLADPEGLSLEATVGDPN